MRGGPGEFNPGDRNTQHNDFRCPAAADDLGGVGEH
jgi:hypothetical protein